MQTKPPVSTATRALTENEMRKAAPSIFAVAGHESRSTRFQPIPTIEILRGLEKEGFVPVGVKQSGTRDANRADFTKHLVRLRRIDHGADYQVGDNVFEILLRNANDGSSSYELLAGMFRIRCLNSLVTHSGTLDAVKVRHMGSPRDVQDAVIEGTYRVLNEAQHALAMPDRWCTIKLDAEERHAFADAARVLRFGESDSALSRAISPVQMLIPRRMDDHGDDLWTTFNIVQENSIKGGLCGVTRDANNRRRRVSTRAVTGIDQDVKLNRALWVLAQRMAELKAA